MMMTTLVAVAPTNSSSHTCHVFDLCVTVNAETATLKCSVS